MKALLIGLLVGVIAVQSARAEAVANCTALEIRAAAAATPSMPPELKALEKKLRKAPFSAWNAFTLLSQRTDRLAQLKPVTLPLKMGKAEVLLRDKSDGRVALTVTMDDENGKRVVDTKVSVPEGDFVVIGRPLGEDGHLLALRCAK